MRRIGAEIPVTTAAGPLAITPLLLQLLLCYLICLPGRIIYAWKEICVGSVWARGARSLHVATSLTFIMVHFGIPKVVLPRKKFICLGKKEK